MHPIHPVALFRLSVLGPLASREQFERGELSRIIKGLAMHPYDIPDSNRSMLSAKTIERWYHLWRQGGIEALAPRPRRDRGQSKLPQALQDLIISAKQDNPSRSIDTIKQYLQDQGVVAAGDLSRSAIHRVLQQQGLSALGQGSPDTERRRFEAAHAGDLWYGDVMHGPKLNIEGRMRKVYLVSLMDDASRLMTHSAFCFSETALDIEGVLKQAVLKRGLPTKLVIDNGPAYRARSLQGICARLEIRVVYCRPFDPASKGKLERYHRFFRAHFLSELNPDCIHNLADLNARLWAWVDGFYHQRVHGSLNGLTPLLRFQQDLDRQHSLGRFAVHLDDIFQHRLQRKVRKDGTVSYQGMFFEVPYMLSGQSIMLVVDPHKQQALTVESLDGEHLGAVTRLDAIANNQRRRQRPATIDEPINKSVTPPAGRNVIEQTLQRQTDQLVPGGKKNNRKAKG
jgi:transposase InsO family protein